MNQHPNHFPKLPLLLLLLSCVVNAQPTEEGAFIEEAFIEEAFIEEAHIAPLNRGNCVFSLEQVDPELLTIDEQIALADRLFNESLHANNDCLNEVQSEAAKSGYSGGVAGGATGGGAGAAGASSPNPASGNGQVTKTTAEEGPPSGTDSKSTGNGRADQGKIETDADKEICNALRDQASAAKSANEKAEITQAAKEFGCRGF